VPPGLTLLMKVLALSPRAFYPADTGGRIRSSRIFEYLAARHRLSLVCFRAASDPADAFSRMAALCDELHTVPWQESSTRPGYYLEILRSLGSTLPFTVRKYTSRAMQATLRKALDGGTYDILICDFLQPSLNCLNLPFGPKVLFEHNVEAQIRVRQVDRLRNPMIRPLFRLEAAKLRAYEGRAARAFDHAIMVSEVDRRTMAEWYGVTTTSSIPTGVDLEYFQAGPTPGHRDIVFTGSMDWLPNQDAVTFFTADVLPLLPADITFTVVGRRPPASITALPRQDSRVRVTGSVEDVRPFVRDAAVYVVPLRIGGGTRIKIYEAMALARAVVSTEVGAEGLPIRAGEHLLLASSPREMANAIQRLLDDPARRLALGHAARRFVEENGSWDAAGARFTEICEQVVESHQRRTT